MKIDAHHHFWHYNPDEYGWIDDSMRVLQRDFLPAHLARELDVVGIDGVVTVQARQSLAETRWLLSLAAQNPFMKGVVGWAPLVEPRIREHLDELASSGALKAVRHVVQDEPDDFLLRDDFNGGVAVLRDYRLAYDLLVFERQLPQAIEFVDHHPRQVFVLDHIAKPRAKDRQLEPWRTNIRRLAERENVYCKLSGLVTEADWKTWTEPELLMYLDVTLEAFGPPRLMFGSDWPVCLLASSYRTWYELVARFCAKLSPDEQSRVLGGTATEAYRLIE
jgi:L-fucono-1,5-lactonase